MPNRYVGFMVGKNLVLEQCVHLYSYPPPISQHATYFSIIDINPKKLKQRGQVTLMMVVEDHGLR